MVFNSIHFSSHASASASIPILQQSLLQSSYDNPFPTPPSPPNMMTEVTMGTNHLQITFPQDEYRSIQTQLARINHIALLFRQLTHTCNKLCGVEIRSTSSNEVCRRQITKDLLREEVVLNRKRYHCPQDINLLKTDLLSKVHFSLSLPIFIPSHSILFFTSRLLYLVEGISLVLPFYVISLHVFPVRKLG